MSLLLSILVGFFAHMLKSAAQSYMAGQRDAVKEIEDASQKRTDAALAAEAEWDALDPAERDRLREQRGHYRDD